MSTKKFQRTVEDFECGHCGAEVIGDGYTNHCPRCLWGKHVDINPGDRKADCQGLMRPTEIELKHGVYRIKHVCVECGFGRMNRASDADDIEMLAELSSASR